MTGWVRDALVELDTRRLAFMVFDAALPRPEGLDVGVGSAHGRAGRELLGFLQRLGFSGLQLGPRGAVSPANPSPYDATTFSINPPLLDFEELTESPQRGGHGLLSERDVARALTGASADLARSADYDLAFRATASLVDQAFRRARAGAPGGSSLLGEVEAFQRGEAYWLQADALYEPLCEQHGAADFTGWALHSRDPEQAGQDAALWAASEPFSALPEGDARPSLLGLSLPAGAAQRIRELSQRHEASVSRYAFVQYLLRRQQSALRAEANRHGIEVYGDLAIGYSRRDQWHFRAAFLPGYRLGAPPSRTNPSGQPWGYPVLHPDHLANRPAGEATSPGPAGRLLAARSAAYFEQFDRVRIDHPHGLVCPWVYREGTGDDVTAVQTGARLYSSPDLPDHPDLARFSLIDASQIDVARARYEDHRIRALSPEQVSSFCRAFGIVARPAAADPERLICEVLSTQPRELGCVLSRYGLGRFRVTQKANPRDEGDVYRTENAKPEDWVLLGNHDTPTIWQCIERWQREGSVRDQADSLAARLSPSPEQREPLAASLRESPFELAHAKLADLFLCDAHSVLIAFTDLLGFRQPYNLPGVVSSENWRLRLPRDYEDRYVEAVRQRAALWLPTALSMALRARRPSTSLLSSGAPPLP